MPIHRLNEQPTRQTIIADITCDCDGKIDKFIDLHDVRHTLPLHELKHDEEYLSGRVPCRGLPGDALAICTTCWETPMSSVSASTEAGEYEFVQEIEGDSVSDVPVLCGVRYPGHGRAASRDRRARPSGPT